MDVLCSNGKSSFLDSFIWHSLEIKKCTFTFLRFIYVCVVLVHMSEGAQVGQRGSQISKLTLHTVVSL